jgi:6-phosphogluconolactonase
MIEAVVSLLEDQFESEGFRPRAVLLSGGQTPLPAYRRLADMPVETGKSVHVIFSDERMVPDNTPESNYENARPMLEALRIPNERVIRVHTGLELKDAADRYDRDIAAFIGRGDITLGLLGLGADGHTASLFSTDDIARGRGRFALAVPREGGLDRVTVTADLLLHVQRIIFLVSGLGKTEIAEKLIRSPQSIPAGQAVAGVSNVELWIG